MEGMPDAAVVMLQERVARMNAGSEPLQKPTVKVSCQV